jgi:imidazolonepropionase-like amidohydrolase
MRVPAFPCSLLLLALVGGGLAASPQQPAAPGGVLVLRNARLLTVTRGEVARGVVVIKEGRIAAVGADGQVTVPAGATSLDLGGATVTPGLVDSHSHLGLGASGGETEDNEGSDPVTPQLRIIDSIHPEGMAPDRNQFRKALAEGVTTVIARPGSSNVIGGQSAVLKLRGGTVDQMVARFPADMKMALGRKGGYASKNQMPTTKMGAAFLVRQAMLDAAEYDKAHQKYDKEKTGKPDATPPARDLKKEAMRMVLKGELPVHIHASPVDDIMTAVRLSEEFRFSMLSIGHGDEAWKIADLLAARKVAVVVGPNMVVYDDENRSVNLAKRLIDKGVEVSMMTDADVVQAPFLRYQAAVAIRHGLDPGKALEAITINPARLARLADRIGSIEVGKDADLVVFDGDPFDIQTHVLKVFVDGLQVFDIKEGR